MIYTYFVFKTVQFSIPNHLSMIIKIRFFTCFNSDCIETFGSNLFSSLIEKIKWFTLTKFLISATKQNSGGNFCFPSNKSPIIYTSRQGRCNLQENCINTFSREKKWFFRFWSINLLLSSPIIIDQSIRNTVSPAYPRAWVSFLLNTSF